MFLPLISFICLCELPILGHLPLFLSLLIPMFFFLLTFGVLLRVDKQVPDSTRATPLLVSPKSLYLHFSLPVLFFIIHYNGGIVGAIPSSSFMEQPSTEPIYQSISRFRGPYQVCPSTHSLPTRRSLLKTTSSIEAHLH